MNSWMQNIYSFLSCFAVYHLVAITVMFSETTYDVNENAGPAQPVLVLSNPSATQFTVRVREAERSATSEQTKYMSMLLLILMILQEMMTMVLDHTLSQFLLEQPWFHLTFQ